MSDIGALGTDEHHMALGRYVSMWGELEMAVNALVADLFEPAFSVSSTRTVVINLSFRDKIEVGKTIVEDRMSKAHNSPARDKISKFLEASRKASLRRNKIVHGRWIARYSSEVVRVAMGLSDWDRMDILNNPNFDRKLASRSIYDVERINNETSRVHQMVKIGYGVRGLYNRPPEDPRSEPPRRLP